MKKKEPPETQGKKAYAEALAHRTSSQAAVATVRGSNEMSGIRYFPSIGLGASFTGLISPFTFS
jgi:hypothetical protein